MSYLKFMLKVAIAMVFISGSAQAATYYVRPDGGSAAECSGLVDAPKSADKQCALSHPYYAFGWYCDGSINPPEGGKAGVVSSGNEVDIKGSYRMGHDPANTFGCTNSAVYGRVMRPIPDNTTIIGDPVNLTELWGAERAKYILSLTGSDNVTIKNLLITDHSECIEFKTCNRTTAPYGLWATNGIVAHGSTNVLIENVQIKGMAYRGILAGRLTNWTLKNVLVRGNPAVGFDGDLGDQPNATPPVLISSNSGYIKFINSKIEYSGCAEGYPDRTKIFNCYGQSQSGYGDGLGTARTNGDWLFENTEISHNVSDGLDLLYAGSGGTLTIIGGKYEGNGGNQIKSAFPTLMDGVFVKGNCGYFQSSGMTMTGWTDNCRAGGNAISLADRGLHPSWTLKNMIVSGEGDVLVLTTGSTNAASKLEISNSTFEGGPQFKYGEPDTTAFYYADNSTVKPALTNVQIAKTKDCAEYGSSCVGGITPAPTPQPAPEPTPPAPEPPPCVPDGTCTALEPSCGQITHGVDSCGAACVKHGAVCPTPTVELCPTCEVCPPFESPTIYTVSQFGSIKPEMYGKMEAGEIVRFYHSTRKKLYQCRQAE